MSFTPPSRKLVFHIGHHKTGSTTIQDALATGRMTLTAGQLLYPARMAHNYLRRHFETYASEGRTLPGTPGFPGLRAISERLQNGNFDIAVISGEDFEDTDASQAQKVLQDFMLPHVSEYVVICYVRPHAPRILSSFAENVKLGFFSGTPDDFYAKTFQSGRFGYAQKLSGWTAAFQKNFLLRPMIRSELVDGSILQDFAANGFGPKYPVSITPAPAANESLCLENLILMRLVQNCLVGRKRDLLHAMGWQISAAISAVAMPKTQGTRLMLHKALAEKIRASYLADAGAMDNQFFGGKPLLRNDLDRAVDEALPDAQSFKPEDHFSAETLRIVAILGDQINQLLDHQSGPWPKFLKERRIARLHGEDPMRMAEDN